MYESNVHHVSVNLNVRKKNPHELYYIATYISDFLTTKLEI